MRRRGGTGAVAAGASGGGKGGDGGGGVTALWNIVEGIRNILYWFPVIWQDRQWDESFLLQILRHKLLRMEHFFRNDSIVSKAAYKAERMRFCTLLINRILAQEYHDRAMMPHVRKWGEGVTRFVYSPDGRYCTMQTTYPNANTPEEEERAKIESADTLHRAMRQERQDHDALFDTMKKHIQCWWD